MDEGKALVTVPSPSLYAVAILSSGRPESTSSLVRLRCVNPLMADA